MRRRPAPPKDRPRDPPVRARALRAMNASGVPYTVAGAYALREYAGIVRDTKDLDLFVRRVDVAATLRVLRRAGFRTELTDPVWLAKGFARSGEYVDVIFSSGNGVAAVDDEWIARARDAEVLGEPSRVASPEDIIWSKAFVCERERYDGADVNHVLRFCGHLIDWRRLARRFQPYPAVLLSHLVLFRFAFPADAHKVPTWLLDRLYARCRREPPAADEPLCRGTLLSRSQYAIDLRLGLRDARDAEVTDWQEHREPSATLH